jgi:hypothetical protein
MRSWVTTVLSYAVVTFIIVTLYLHAYLHLSVSSDNQVLGLDDVCKEEITNYVYFKQPFLFDGTSVTLDAIDTLHTTQLGKCTIGALDYPSKGYELLEPNVRFYPKHFLIKLDEVGDYCPVEMNLECRTFYKVHQGKVQAVCIHPKYSEHFNHDNHEYAKSNHRFLHLELHKNSILFLPNYWHVYIEALDPSSVVQKLQYKTIMNEVSFLYDKFVSKKTDKVHSLRQNEKNQESDDIIGPTKKDVDESPKHF